MSTSTNPPYDSSDAPLSGRYFLLLQGPQSHFFRRLADGLVKEGARVDKVNFCGGDRMLWGLGRRALDYTGTLYEWPEWIGHYYREEGVTDICLYGDWRPLHWEAVRLAYARGIRVWVFEEGYLRAGFSTLEENGVNGRSSLPVNPQDIREMAVGLPDPKAITVENDIRDKVYKAIYDVTSMPVIITFFPGLCYQKRYESFSVRSLCDLILFNNEYEYGEYLNFASQFNLQNAGFVAGFHSNANDEKDCTVSSNDFIFSEQVAVPNTITERLYLAAKLVEFSNSIRGSGVLYVKPRISVRERTLFRPKLHIVDAIKCVDKPKSDNLIITYESVHKHVQCGASSITVSSTAGVEALEFHSRSYFISDFGPLEQHGGDYFIDSGTYITFQDMINGVRGAVRPEWIATRYQLFDVDGFFSRIDKLINTNERIGLNNSHKLFSAELLLKSPRTHLSVLSYFRKILRYFWV